MTGCSRSARTCRNRALLRKSHGRRRLPRRTPRGCTADPGQRGHGCANAPAVLRGCWPLRRRWRP
eukprot:5657685-Lingulodinium_polyedra.AAC.1